MRFVRTKQPLTDHVTVSLLFLLHKVRLWWLESQGGHLSKSHNACSVHLSFFQACVGFESTILLPENLVDHNSEPIFHILVLEDVRRFYSRKDDEKKHSFRELEREVRAPKGLRHLDQGCHLKTGLPTNWCHQNLLSLTYFV